MKLISVSFFWSRILLITGLNMILSWSYAQSILPVENNKIVFYEVTSTDSIPKELLHQNAYNWLVAQKFTSIVDSLTAEGHKLSAVSEYPVYATGYLTKRQNGSISYKIQIEVKENKYRYRFTDFVFHYYHENRNYQVVPTGKVKPLEDTNASGWQKTWEFNKKTTYVLVNSLISDLKKAIVYNPTQEKMAKGPAKEW